MPLAIRESRNPRSPRAQRQPRRPPASAAEPHLQCLQHGCMRYCSPIRPLVSLIIAFYYCSEGCAASEGLLVLMRRRFAVPAAGAGAGSGAGLPAAAASRQRYCSCSSCSVTARDYDCVEDSALPKKTDWATLMPARGRVRGQEAAGGVREEGQPRRQAAAARTSKARPRTDKCKAREHQAAVAEALRPSDQQVSRVQSPAHFVCSQRRCKARVLCWHSRLHRSRSPVSRTRRCETPLNALHLH